MHVCGRWLYLPFYKDHAVALPLQWQAWINDAPARDGDNDGDDSGDETKRNDWEDINNNDKDDGNDDDNNDEIGEDMANTIGPEHDCQSNSSSPGLSQSQASLHGFWLDFYSPEIVISHLKDLLGGKEVGSTPAVWVFM